MKGFQVLLRWLGLLNAGVPPPCPRSVLSVL